MHERLVIPRKSTRTVETPQCWSLGKQWLGFCFSVFAFLRWGTPWKGLNWKDQTQVKLNFCSSFPLPLLAVFSLENPFLLSPPLVQPIPADPSTLGSETPIPESLTHFSTYFHIKVWCLILTYWLQFNPVSFHLSITLEMYVQSMMGVSKYVYFKSGVSRACRLVGRSVFRKLPIGWWPQGWEVEVIDKLVPAVGLWSLVPDTRYKRDMRAWIPNSVTLSTCLHSTSWIWVILNPPQLAGGRLER